MWNFGQNKAAAKARVGDEGASQWAKERHASIVSSFDSCSALIVFDRNGIVQDANANFLLTTGYSLGEIVGNHHKQFVDPVDSAQPAYEEFWESLRRGRAECGIFRRVKKSGATVWLQASYMPMLNAAGEVEGVVKTAVDITNLKDAESKLLNRSHAYIEFTSDGTILGANDLFLEVMGYRLADIKGRHHSMFMPPEEAKTEDYAKFWKSLGEGHVHSGEYLRIKADGSDIWLASTYSPVLDLRGRVVRVTKLAQDATAAVHRRDALESTGATIATGVRELAEAAAEISQSVATNASLSEGVRQRAMNASETIAALHQSSERIGDIMGVIGALADQTNLLALNATIESARAGEAGKGFAVVASEVKELARQTKDATEKIGDQVEEIQANVSSVVSAVGTIRDEVTAVSENTSSVAAAVEEQTTVIATLSENAESLSEPVGHAATR